MSLVITPNYTWTDGDVVTATRLNSTPTIADGQAGVFSTISATIPTFSGQINSTSVGAILQRTGASTGVQYCRLANTSGSILVGVEQSAGGGLATGTTAYDSYIGSEFGGLGLGSAGTQYARLTSTGLSVTGALSATTGLNSTAVGNVNPSTGAFTGLNATTLTGQILLTSTNEGNGRVSANFDATATTSLALVTGLTINVVAGASYSFRAVLILNQTGNGGYAVGLLGTATATSINFAVSYLGTAANSSNSGSVASLGTSFNYNLTSGLTARAYLDGTITVNTSGTLGIAFAQNTAIAASTVTAGSYVKFWKD